MGEVILKMENIQKSFPGVRALDHVDFQLERGEVHALLGENGAGKSTLIKILAGIYTADGGSITIHGQECKIENVLDSQSKGISVIHQELCLVPYMTVAENIFLGREPTYKSTGLVKKQWLYKETKKLLDSLEIEISAYARISSLSVAQQQMVEIAKALSVNAKIIIMDEPTSSLTEKEVEVLFKTIANLKEEKISFIYISHRMEELFRITDRITILRDGHYIGTRVSVGATREELIAMMVGRELKEFYIKRSFVSDETILEVQHVNKPNVLHDINFSLKKGEILGISGLIGAGRTELARIIFGVDSGSTGQILIEGKKTKICSPIDAIENGIVLVPENRKEQGLFLINTVEFNITVAVLNHFIKFIRVNKQIEQEIASEYISMLSIKTPSSTQIVNNLSGGNQQKVVIAKWLSTRPKVLILDEPTRGIDVGAKAEIYSLMNTLTEQGIGIIMISSELPEIINMSDRVIVMHNGRIAGLFDNRELNQEKIMECATGGGIR